MADLLPTRMFAKGQENLISSNESPLGKTVIAILITSSLFGALMGLGKTLNYVFPVMSLVTGIILYRNSSTLYVGFSFWLYFLTPLLRRLVDYFGHSYTEPSPILIAPFLVSLITLSSLVKQLPKIKKNWKIPVVLCLSGVIYGFFVGFARYHNLSVFVGFLKWFSPISFGLIFLVNWHRYPSYKRTFQEVFQWAVLILGIYGVIQFLVAPEWEVYWADNVQLGGLGIVEPLNVRVYSTLNSGEPFVAVMSAGLLMLFATNFPLQVPASVVGYLSFLLSLGRSGWLGWVAGLPLLLQSLKPHLRMRLVITLVIISLCVVPLVMIDPFAGVIQARMNTLSDLQNDGSAQARTATYQNTFDEALFSVVGKGLGAPGFDSAFLTMLINLGWIGSIAYATGLILMMLLLFRSSRKNHDPFIQVCQAVVFSSLVRFPLNVPLLEISGIILWSFMALGIAGLTYHQKYTHDLHDQ